MVPYVAANREDLDPCSASVSGSAEIVRIRVDLDPYPHHWPAVTGPAGIRIRMKVKSRIWIRLRAVPVYSIACFFSFFFAKIVASYPGPSKNALELLTKFEISSLLNFTNF